MSDVTSDSWSTWSTLLRSRALSQPERLAYRFLVDGERDERVVTYAGLDGAARSLAATLLARHGPGSRLLLLYPPGLDFIAALFGTWYAGMVAVPCPLPKPSRPGRRRAAEESLPAVAADARAAGALTTAPFLAAVEEVLRSATREPIRCLATDALSNASSQVTAEWVEPAFAASHGYTAADAAKPQAADGPERLPDPAVVGAGGLAVLQYTSGSTRSPRGVMLTHANLLHNSRVIRERFGHTPDTRAVVWLPHYHDMGLIGGILQPMFAGFAVTLMAPAAFVQKPRRWLEAVTRYGANTSGGPNSAYELCVRAVPPEQRAGLDLSTWDLAFNGAEPVRAETLRRFAEAFGPCGFRAEAFYPCYGLAEATLIVAGGEKGRRPVMTQHGRAGASLVGCGTARACDELVIVDPATGERCGAGAVGEIWVRGPSVARGYFGDDEATRASPLQGNALRTARSSAPATSGSSMRPASCSSPDG